MSDLNQRIGQAHSDLEKREADSRQLEERLRAIPGMNRFIPQRAYGAAVNVDAIKGSLSARSLINAHDVHLASYLGIQSGSARAAAEARETAKKQAESLRVKTEQLAAENAFARQQMENAIRYGINPVTGRRFGE